MSQRKQKKGGSGAAAAPPVAKEKEEAAAADVAPKATAAPKDRPRQPLTPEQQTALDRIKARETRWDWVKTLLYVPVILLFWRAPLYTWTPEAPAAKADRVPISVSAAQRACYEMLGPLSVLRMNPPGV
jgi:hypothetical protein